jgi:hypothetical protein
MKRLDQVDLTVLEQLVRNAMRALPRRIVMKGATVRFQNCVGDTRRTVEGLGAAAAPVATGAWVVCEIQRTPNRWTARPAKKGVHRLVIWRTIC